MTKKKGNYIFFKYQIVNEGFYFSANIFFDDAFVLRKPENEQDTSEDIILNQFVIMFVNTIEKAAREVHSTDVQLNRPVKYPTPYGGRLVWTLPGKTKLIVHLKDKDKIRHKKRWSQVSLLLHCENSQYLDVFKDFVINFLPGDHCQFIKNLLNKTTVKSEGKGNLNTRVGD
jgi:hypothetical protein